MLVEPPPFPLKPEVPFGKSQNRYFIGRVWVYRRPLRKKIYFQVKRTFETLPLREDTHNFFLVVDPLRSRANNKKILTSGYSDFIQVFLHG